NFKSCLDVRRNGVQENGIYTITDTSGDSFRIFCDFTSESNSAWTLIMSQAFKNRHMAEFCSKPLTINAPVQENTPNWEAYRLSLTRMQLLSKQSTHLRITTSFAAYGMNYKDYVRAKISDIDVVTYDGSGVCLKVEFINIRGNTGTDVTVQFWQGSTFIFHTDTTNLLCQFDGRKGVINNENDFGNYLHTTRRDTTRHGTTRHGTTRHGTTRCDTTRYDTTRYDTTRYDKTRYDTVRHDTIRYDTVRQDTTRYDKTRYDKTRYDTTRYDTTRYDTTRHGTTRYDKTRYDTVRHGTTRQDTIRHGTTRYDKTRHDTTRYDTTRYDTTRYDKTRYDKTRYDTLEPFSYEWETYGTELRSRLQSVNSRLIGDRMLGYRTIMARYGHCTARRTVP
ncbi:hypothetical protein QZH41_000187, partial [Actinostola sp. cb2023]